MKNSHEPYVCKYRCEIRHMNYFITESNEVPLLRSHKFHVYIKIAVVPCSTHVIYENTDVTSMGGQKISILDLRNIVKVDFVTSYENVRSTKRSTNIYFSLENRLLLDSKERSWFHQQTFPVDHALCKRNITYFV